MGFIRENFGTRNMHTLLICEYYIEYIEATHNMKLIGLLIYTSILKYQISSIYKLSAL